jgi:hypothetical protein
MTGSYRHAIPDCFPLPIQSPRGVPTPDRMGSPVRNNWRWKGPAVAIGRIGVRGRFTSTYAHQTCERHGYEEMTYSRLRNCPPTNSGKKGRKSLFTWLERVTAPASRKPAIQLPAEFLLDSLFAPGDRVIRACILFRSLILLHRTGVSR